MFIFHLVGGLTPLSESLFFSGYTFFRVLIVWFIEGSLVCYPVIAQLVERRTVEVYVRSGILRSLVQIRLAGESLF